MDKVYTEYKERKLSAVSGSEFIGIGNLVAGTVSTEFDLEGTATTGFGKAARVEKVLNVKEKQLLLSVERGDMASMRSVLEMSEEDKGIDINCRDPLGRSALLIAIEYENIEIMEVLLSYNVTVNDALLHAINEECVEAVELLLKHEDKHKSKTEKLEKVEIDTAGKGKDRFESDSFTPDITPLMLAAHKDNYEIIKILLERGETIPKPHPVQCACKPCVSQNSDDTLCHSRSRINAYKALASPSLICLSSRDPILTAFELSWELRRLSKLEHEFKSPYIKLSEQSSVFATELLDQTRGSEELEIILNHDSDLSPLTLGNQGMTLSRLKLAIKFQQREFVAHPHCQQLLSSIWYEGLPGFRRQNATYKAMLIFTIGLLAPMSALIYIFCPRTKFGKLMRQPFIKFIVHSALYCFFLLLLILASQRLDFEFPTGRSNRLQNEKRGRGPTNVEYLIAFYVVGLIWAEAKQVWLIGLEEYATDMWNLLDFATNVLYLCTMTLRVISFVKVLKEKEDGRQFSAELERSYWDAYDPSLIAEALFAAANILSTLKLVYIFSVNPYLGPLQISLGRMLLDITKWAVVCVLVLFSFACGLNQLLWYYTNSGPINNADECTLNVDTDSSACNAKLLKHFPNLFQIMQTLYWAMFGLVDHDAITLCECHSFTQLAGRTMFGVYSYITVIVLLNMLIAMMNNSYQTISSEADSEWKFARSKLWLSYFEEGTTLPAPFNFIPTPKTAYYFLIWLKNQLCSSCSHQIKKNRWLSIRKSVRKINDRELRYQFVMRNLIKRYIMNKSRGKIDDGVTEDDINEIKQEVSSFRYELVEILRSNGMAIPDNERKPNNAGQGSKRFKQVAEMVRNLNAMKMKRKSTYLKQWQKKVSAPEPSSDAARSLTSSIDSGAAGSLTTLNSSQENISAAKPTTERDVSKFQLKRSQSAVSFNTAIKVEMKEKSTSHWPGGNIIKNFISRKKTSSPDSKEQPPQGKTNTEFLSLPTESGSSNSRAAKKLSSASNDSRRSWAMFTLSEESD